jgi:hypothetical protein
MVAMEHMRFFFFLIYFRYIFYDANFKGVFPTFAIEGVRQDKESQTHLKSTLELRDKYIGYFNNVQVIIWTEFRIIAVSTKF